VTPAPPRVTDSELYWSSAPPEPSPRCTWWLKRIDAGWRPNKRVRRLGYYDRAAYYGVYIWELLNKIDPALTQGVPMLAQGVSQ